MKATFSVTLVISSHLTALSNMPELSCTHLPSTGGQMLKKVVFDTSPKMSTYLLAWAVGEFDFVQGTTKGGVMLRVFSPPGRALQGKFALDVGIRSLDFYDQFFKVKICDLEELTVQVVSTKLLALVFQNPKSLTTGIPIYVMCSRSPTPCPSWI